MRNIFGNKLAVFAVWMVMLAGCTNPEMSAPANISISNNVAFGTYTLSWTHALPEVPQFEDWVWTYEVEETVIVDGQTETVTFYTGTSHSYEFPQSYTDGSRVSFRVRLHDLGNGDPESYFLSQWSQLISRTVGVDL